MDVQIWDHLAIMNIAAGNIQKQVFVSMCFISLGGGIPGLNKTYV